MTTKPKVNKYSAKRTPQGSGTAEARSKAMAKIRQATQDQAKGDPSSDIEKIKNEGLTGRQLRVARRLAQKHGLDAQSDFEAVKLLREMGIDPFQRANLLDLAANDQTGPSSTAQENTKIQLPQTFDEKSKSVTGLELSPAQRREYEIGQIQKDVARRRRRKLVALFMRLAVFVFIPTFVVGYYFYRVATPMYASSSVYQIETAEGAGAVGGFLTGTQYATAQDTVASQEFLESKDALVRLNRDIGFSEVFKQDWIDPVQRLSPDATLEEEHKLYRKVVTIGYDPADGIVRMEVATPDPEYSVKVSHRLIEYAEETLNNLSELKRNDQMRDALKSFEDAEEARRRAQEDLIELQLQGAILDPQSVIASLRARSDQVEIQLQDKELELAALLDNTRPNQAKVDGVSRDIARLEAVLAELNAEMLDMSAGENSLARLSVRIQMAQADLAARDMMLQSAMQQVETTRTEANRKVRYLTVSVNPVASQEPTYPRKFENTILAFLLFAGIYLMISLTASVLREQVSS
ncbi:MULTISPECIES: capsule biosynthesis protein [unclassified Ruegeria]|uniref:capsule biosynthesis protein n=1 Tax=unclassified Ruegeria TaxID=2625375 RepID=UPI0014887823|nr:MULTISPECIES: capsule biosynthesis protein [unclassified Ruegeria]